MRYDRDGRREKKRRSCDEICTGLKGKQQMREDMVAMMKILPGTYILYCIEMYLNYLPYQ